MIILSEAGIHILPGNGSDPDSALTTGVLVLCDELDVATTTLRYGGIVLKATVKANYFTGYTHKKN